VNPLRGLSHPLILHVFRARCEGSEGDRSLDWSGTGSGHGVARSSRSKKTGPSLCSACPRFAPPSDQLRSRFPVSIQFATDLLRHCVTRSHCPGKTSAAEPTASERIASHDRSTRLRTIPPPAARFATDLLRHCVTRLHTFEGSQPVSASRLAPIRLASHGTKWHSVALNSNNPHLAHSQFPARDKARRHATERKETVDPDGPSDGFVSGIPSTLSSAIPFWISDRISISKTSYAFLAT
jgi:hypothetical protein